MRVPAGKRDTKVQILTFVEVQDPDFGTVTKSWSVLAEEWAEVRDFLPSRAEEQVGGVVNIARRPTRVRIPFRSDVRPDMRLVIRGETYEIISGPAELGRKDGLELVCEVLSVQGDRP